MVRGNIVEVDVFVSIVEYDSSSSSELDPYDLLRHDFVLLE